MLLQVDVFLSGADVLELVNAPRDEYYDPASPSVPVQTLDLCTFQHRAYVLLYSGE